MKPVGVCLTAVYAWVLPVVAQTDSAIPRLPNGKPDFNGVWQRPYVPDMSATSRDGAQRGPGQIPFTAEYVQKFKE